MQPLFMRGIHFLRHLIFCPEYFSVKASIPNFKQYGLIFFLPITTAITVPFCGFSFPQSQEV